MWHVGCTLESERERIPCRTVEKRAIMVKHTTPDNATFTGIRDFLTTYITFAHPVQADICALWVIGTHILHHRFDSYGYLCINAATKRAGKSVLAELMAMVSRDGVIGTSITAAVMRRLVARKATLFFDESESLNSEASSTVREFLNVGYRVGQNVFMPGEGDEVLEYPAYGGKCVVLIGDPNDTLRDRSITITLRRAPLTTARKIYRHSEAMEHASILVGTINKESHDSQLTRTVEAFTDDVDLTYDDAYEFLDSRTAETFTPIFALARLYCPLRLESIIAYAVDIDSLKQSTTGKSYRVIREEHEANASDASFRERAMRDLASVIHDAERAIYTDVAIARMKDIATGPWRTYKGNGLTPTMLSDLLSTLVNTKSVKLHGKTKRGFQRVDILNGLVKLGKDARS
jgi:hypothetical protein